jgi:hypothetical protein
LSGLEIFFYAMITSLKTTFRLSFQKLYIFFDTHAYISLHKKRFFVYIYVDVTTKNCEILKFFLSVRKKSQPCSF